MFINKLRSHSIRFINTKILNKKVKIFINELINFRLESISFTDKNFLKVLSSSNVNEVIRAMLSFYFIYEKILHAQKAQNAYKRTKRKNAAFLCA